MTGPLTPFYHCPAISRPTTFRPGPWGPCSECRPTSWICCTRCGEAALPVVRRQKSRPVTNAPRPTRWHSVRCSTKTTITRPNTDWTIRTSEQPDFHHVRVQHAVLLSCALCDRRTRVSKRFVPARPDSGSSSPPPPRTLQRPPEAKRDLVSLSIQFLPTARIDVLCTVTCVYFCGLGTLLLLRIIPITV